jgi:hypothetical protein
MAPEKGLGQRHASLEMWAASGGADANSLRRKLTALSAYGRHHDTWLRREALRRAAPWGCRGRTAAITRLLAAQHPIEAEWSPQQLVGNFSRATGFFGRLSPQLVRASRAAERAAIQSQVGSDRYAASAVRARRRNPEVSAPVWDREANQAGNPKRLANC